MSVTGTKRGLSFYLLAAFFTLFVVFLYGPMLIIFVLSFQGPTGGLTFPMRGASLYWFSDLFSSSRYGDLAGGFRRSAGLGSVSYTHLDVYKRQTCSGTLRSTISTGALMAGRAPLSGGRAFILRALPPP